MATPGSRLEAEGGGRLLREVDVFKPALCCFPISTVTVFSSLAWVPCFFNAGAFPFGTKKSPGFSMDVWCQPECAPASHLWQPTVRRHAKGPLQAFQVVPARFWLSRCQMAPRMNEGSLFDHSNPTVPGFKSRSPVHKLANLMNHKQNWFSIIMGGCNLKTPHLGIFSVLAFCAENCPCRNDARVAGSNSHEFARIRRYHLQLSL